MSDGPLTGIRVIAVEQYGALPFGTMFLSDLGADVIKVEDPSVGGDVSRYVPPGQEGTDSLFFESFNRGKRSIALDLKTSAGQEVLGRLAASASALVCNVRGDQVRPLGLDYESLKARNPGIVCASLSAYGGVGERASLPGYDALVQAETGWADLTGDPAGPPTKSGLSLVDYVAGLITAVGVLAAIIDTKSTGIGGDVATSLYDAGLSMLSYPATWFLTAGLSSTRLPMSAHPSIVPFQFFETKDGFVAVATPKQKFFVELVQGMDLGALLDDSRFSDFGNRQTHRDPLLEILGNRFRERTTTEWIDDLRGTVPIAPVRSMDEALSEADLRDRGMLAEYDHPTFGVVRSVGLPIRVSGREVGYRRGPGYDEHRGEILVAAGFDDNDVAALGRGGAFGASRPIGDVRIERQEG